MSQHFSDNDDFDGIIEFIDHWFNPRTLRGFFCYVAVITFIMYLLFG